MVNTVLHAAGIAAALFCVAVWVRSLIEDDNDPEDPTWGL